MKNLLTKTVSLFILLAFMGCQEAEKKEESQASDDAAKPKITLEKLTGSPDFADASLALTSATPGENGSFNMEFDVQNFTLGEQTEPKPSTALANSGKGQHIHVIVDNKPYEAHYEPSVTTDKLSAPGRHVVLAFLSRSYHESVKNMGEAASFVLEQYHIGEGSSEEVDFSAPHLFYSRPKGTYSGPDTDNLLLDFFVLNADLAEDGYQVRATIEGEVFMITDWAPYVITGLPKGEISVQLELLDAEGNAVPGPYNNVIRTVMLEE